MNEILPLKSAVALMVEFIQDYKPSAKIVRLEIKIKPVDILLWLSQQPSTQVKIYGANQSDTSCIGGVGEAVSVSGTKLSSYAAILKQLRKHLTIQYPYLQWYGGFCFDDRKLDISWKEFGAYRFVIPRFEIAQDHGKQIFCCNLQGKINKEKILKELELIHRHSELQLRPVRRSFSEGERISSTLISETRKDQPNQLTWQKHIQQVLSQQKIQKVVLARKTDITFKETPNPWEMLRQLKKVTPNSYHFAFSFGGSVFLGASPERLYRRYDRLMESEALAGTLPKKAKADALKNSIKNQHEHSFVVQAIDDNFKNLTQKYMYDRTPEVLSLANGHHLITKFKGELKQAVQDEDVLKAFHPTPALGGTPRKEALDYIRNSEKFARGWYGAPVGYVGLNWAEFVVAIRSGLVQKNKLSVYAGAGIVQGSKAEEEWIEVENKISNFIKIIS